MWRKKHRSCLLLWKENWKLPLISTFNEKPIIRCCLPTRITMLCYDYCAEIQPTNVSYAACRFIGKVSMSILCCKQKPLWLCGGPNTYLCVDNNDSNSIQSFLFHCYKIDFFKCCRDDSRSYNAWIKFIPCCTAFKI